jgi:hypothetical protein
MLKPNSWVLKTSSHFQILHFETLKKRFSFINSHTLPFKLSLKPKYEVNFDFNYSTADFKTKTSNRTKNP